MLPIQVNRREVGKEIKDIRLRIQGPDILWEQIKGKNQQKSKGALIIYNDQQIDYVSHRQDYQIFKKRLQKKDFNVYQIINIQNVSIQSKSLDHLIDEIKEFFHQNYYLSLVYFVSHGIKNAGLDANLMQIFVQSNGKTNQSQRKQLQIRKVLNAWQPECVKHLVIFLEACYMGSATQIFLKHYPHLINVSLITASDKLQCAIYHTQAIQPTNTTHVMSPLRTICFFQEGKFQYDQIKQFIKMINSKKFQLTGSIDISRTLEFLNDQIFRKLEFKGIPLTAIAPINISFNNMSKRRYKQFRYPIHPQQQLRSIYYGQGQGKIRNNYGMFWHQRLQQYQLFYFGQSEKGTFCGKGFKLEKKKNSNKNQVIKGWGSFKQGLLHDQCYIEKTQWYNYNQKRQITQKILTTMYNDILLVENNKQQYQIRQKRVCYAKQTYQETFHFEIWSQIWKKEGVDEYGLYYEWEKKMKLFFTIDIEEQTNFRTLRNQLNCNYLLKDQLNKFKKENTNIIKRIQRYTIVKDIKQFISIVYKIDKEQPKTRLFKQCLSILKLKNPFKRFFDKSKTQQYVFDIIYTENAKYIGAFYKFLTPENTLSQPEDLVQYRLSKRIRKNKQIFQVERVQQPFSLIQRPDIIQRPNNSRPSTQIQGNAFRKFNP